MAARKKRAARKAYHHGDLRRALMDAALAIIERSGPHAVTISEAARTAGVSPGAPFHHFENKEALLKAIVEEGCHGMAELAAVEIAKAGSDPTLLWLAGGIAHVKFAVKYPAHFRVMSVPELAALSPAPLMQAVIEESKRSMATLIAQGTSDAERAKAAKTLSARSLVHGLASMFAHGQLPHEGLTDRDLERLVRALARQLGQNTATSSKA